MWNYYSDQNAPLAAKERIWAAQKKYLTFAVERVRLEKWLAKAKRSYATRDLVRNIREVQDALHHIKTQMEKLALITGAQLPQPNPIRDWSFEQKFSRAAEIALQSGKLAPEVAAELQAAIQPANLARMAAMMAALAAAHAYPVAGLAADAVLLTYVGTDGALTGHRLYLEISSIQNEADLNAAADVLKKELASQASGKLIDLLTWGTGKGVGAFNKRYKVTIDHNQVRQLSTGEMPLTPNPKKIIPLKIVKKEPTRKAIKPSDKYVFDPNWTHTWSLENRSRNVKVLADNLEIGPLQTDGRAPHHIVQAANNKSPAFQEARDILLAHQIDINSAANGVALQSPKSQAKLNPGLRRHSGGNLHTEAGGKIVLKVLEEAVRRGGRDWHKRRKEIIKALDQMRAGILANTFP